MLGRSTHIRVLLAIGFMVTAGGTQPAAQADSIIALERRALDRWGAGDPGGYLDLYATGVTYFDPMRETRVDGLEAMRQALEPLRGLIRIDRYEMLTPKVDRAGDAAILTYNLVSHGRAPNGQPTVTRWNTTAVYVRVGEQWKILHSHFSFTLPKLETPMPSQP